MKKKQCILIVDDDADDREIMRDAFVSSSDDFEFHSLESGDKLIEYLQKDRNGVQTSLIMLDLNMPGKDGRETLKELKSSSSYQHIPVIVFTTSSSNRDRQMVYDLGANCFISKPDTFSKLIEITNCISRLWLQP